MSESRSDAAAAPTPDLWRRGSLRRRSASAAAAGPLVVVKIGGSLLGRRGWPALVGPLVAGSGPGPKCLVVGGGRVVDGLRAIDLAAPQPPRLMHDLAIEAMRLTARLVAEAVGYPLATAPPTTPVAVVLDVPAWLAGEAADPLPVGWHVTSDTIAARVAVVHRAGLLLAKSVPPLPCPAGLDPVAALAAAGWVDGAFPAAAEPLETIEWAAPRVQAGDRGRNGA